MSRLRFATDAPQGMGGPTRKLPEIAGAQVGQLMLFPITPEVLYRVKFRGIGRKAFHPDFTAQTFQVLTHQSATVGCYTVPDDEQLAFHMTLQVFQEIDYLHSFDRSGIEPEVKVPPGESGNGRELFPVKVKLQYRRLTFGTPRAHPMWLLAQTAFVDE